MATNKTAYMREYMRQYRLDGRDKTIPKPVHIRNLDRKFVGCDGEGTTLDSGYHAYFMLRIGSETLRPEPGNVRLSTWECLDFISRLDPAVCYVGYFFDYDVTKILEDLPFTKLLRLTHRSMRAGLNGKLFPVDYREFQVEYLPRKEFKVRRKLSQVDDDTQWSPWIVISDVGSFFQKPFYETIADWDIGTPEEREMIRVGKAQRATFDVADSVDIEAYNALEIKLTQTLMDRFRTACVAAGYVPRKWQGPGLLAEAMFKTHGVPKSRDTPLLNDDEFSGLLRFAASAYYGGRTEVAAIGPVNQPVYQKDINGAYPHAMRFVPCLLHGGWEHVATPTATSRSKFAVPTGAKGESYALIYGSFKRRDTQRSLWYGLPVRTKEGTIVFPEEGAGWYWSFEVESAIHQDFTTKEMWVYTRKCDCRPLAFVEQVYSQRQAIGKNGPGVVLKLGMNSLYGKTVQSIGKPMYANAIWGSFLTAFPRMMLNDFIHSSPSCLGNRCGTDILMLATDSVASTTDRRDDYPNSEALGGWSSEVHPNGLFIVQPGVYFGSSGKPSKTRGVPRTIVDAYEAVFRDAFNVMVETQEMSDGDVSVPQTIFVGIRYAVHRRNLKLLGQWIEFGEEGRSGKTVSFDWTSKRALSPALAPSATRSYIQTFPYQGSESIHTIGYSKDIGGLRERELLRLPFEEQPDWAGVIYDE
jgi:hypothetical protein